jgi:hypothetical protein
LQTSSIRKLCEVPGAVPAAPTSPSAGHRPTFHGEEPLIEPAERGLPLERLERQAAIGYLKYKRALTDKVDSYLVYRNYPKYDIVEKICRKLNQQPLRQRRGLEQRGVAQNDVRFARSFALYLERNGLIETPGGRPDMVSTTAKGRAILSRFIATKELPPEIEEFLRRV